MHLFDFYVGFGSYFLDLSLTNIILPLIFNIVVLRLLLNNSIKYFTLLPNGLQLFFEQSFLFIFNLVKQQIGSKGFVYFPFLFTLFSFILFSNLLSMTPFGFALTSHIIMIFFLSLSIGIATFLIGLSFNGLKLFSLFIPQCPFVLLPFLIIIEIFSYIIRSFSLAIRLSANIMAGHTLVFIISSFVLKISSLKFFLFFIFCTLVLAILLLELGVAFLQAYVFLILVSIYLSDSIHLNH